VICRALLPFGSKYRRRPDRRYFGMMMMHARWARIQPSDPQHGLEVREQTATGFTGMRLIGPHMEQPRDSK
jgi:hypothetical protein